MKCNLPLLLALALPLLDGVTAAPTPAPRNYRGNQQRARALTDAQLAQMQAKAIQESKARAKNEAKNKNKPGSYFKETVEFKPNKKSVDIVTKKGKNQPTKETIKTVEKMPSGKVITDTKQKINNNPVPVKEVIQEVTKKGSPATEIIETVKKVGGKIVEDIVKVKTPNGVVSMVQDIQGKTPGQIIDTFTPALKEKGLGGSLDTVKDVIGIVERMRSKSTNDVVAAAVKPYLNAEGKPVVDKVIEAAKLLGNGALSKGSSTDLLSALAGLVVKEFTGTPHGKVPAPQQKVTPQQKPAPPKPEPPKPKPLKVEEKIVIKANPPSPSQDPQWLEKAMDYAEERGYLDEFLQWAEERGLIEKFSNWAKSQLRWAWNRWAPSWAKPLWNQTSAPMPKFEKELVIVEQRPSRK